MTTPVRTLSSLVAGLAMLVLPYGPSAAAPITDAHPGGVTFVGPTSAHPSSIFWNPAAIGPLSGHHLLLSTGWQVDQSDISRAPFDSTTGEPTGAPLDPANGAFTLTPTGFLGFASDLNSDHYRLGLAAYTPFAERYQNQDDLAYHTRGGSYYALFTTIAFAYHTSYVDVGLGVSLVFSYFDLRYDRDRGLEDCPLAPCTVEDPTLREELTVESDDYHPALAVHLGAVVRPPALGGVTLGASYMSPPRDYQHSDIILDGDVQALGLVSPGDPMSLAYKVSGDSRLTYRLPQMLNFGARYAASPALDLFLDFRWLDFSTHRLYDLRFIGAPLRAQDVPEWAARYRGFQDVFSVTGGAEWDATPDLRLAAQLRLETSAVEKALVSAAQLDAPKLELGLGGELALSPGVTVQAGYALAAYLPRDVEDSAFSPSAYQACQASGYDLDTCEPARLGRAIPTAAGRYTQLRHQLTLGLVFHWW